MSATRHAPEGQIPHTSTTQNNAESEMPSQYPVSPRSLEVAEGAAALVELSEALVVHDTPSAAHTSTFAAINVPDTREEGVGNAPACASALPGNGTATAAADSIEGVLRQELLKAGYPAGQQMVSREAISSAAATAASKNYDETSDVDDSGFVEGEMSFKEDVGEPSPAANRTSRPHSTSLVGSNLRPAPSALEQHLGKRKQQFGDTVHPPDSTDQGDDDDDEMARYRSGPDIFSMPGNMGTQTFRHPPSTAGRPPSLQTSQYSLPIKGQRGDKNIDARISDMMASGMSCKQTADQFNAELRTHGFDGNWTQNAIYNRYDRMGGMTKAKMQKLQKQQAGGGTQQQSRKPAKRVKTNVKTAGVSVMPATATTGAPAFAGAMPAYNATGFAAQPTASIGAPTMGSFHAYPPVNPPATGYSNTDPLNVYASSYPLIAQQPAPQQVPSVRGKQGHARRPSAVPFSVAETQYRASVTPASHPDRLMFDAQEDKILQDIFGTMQINFFYQVAELFNKYTGRDVSAEEVEARIRQLE